MAQNKDQKIYKGQAYTISLDTATNLSLATDKKIRYRTPDLQTTGYLAATLAADGQTLSALVSSALNTVAGYWEFRAWVTWANDPAPVPGVPVKIRVDDIS